MYIFEFENLINELKSSQCMKIIKIDSKGLEYQDHILYLTKLKRCDHYFNQNIQIDTDASENQFKALNPNRDSFTREKYKGLQKTRVYREKSQKFRCQQRKQFLNNFFKNKRSQLFKWKFHSQNPNSNDQIQHSANGKQYVVEDNHSFEEDIEIQRLMEINLQNLPQIPCLKPAYSQKYFQSILLLGQLITLNQPSQKQQSQQRNKNFKFASFYDFLVSLIRKGLDPEYFFKFENNNFFKTHFNALKNIILNQLANQISTFAYTLKEFNGCLTKEQDYKWRKIIVQTSKYLIGQLSSMIEGRNLISQSYEYRYWPIVPIQQQLDFLLKMLIEITYYDKTYVNHRTAIHQEQNYEVLNKKYSKIFYTDCYQNQYANQEIQSVYATKYIVEETNICNSLKFMLVYGFPSDNLQCCPGESYDDRIKKQRISLVIIDLLNNISINVGSDVLFQEGLIAQLNCILKQPYYKVNIRQGFKRKSQFQQFSLYKFKIKQLLICCFQKIRRQQSLQFLTKMDSFQLTLKFLSQIQQGIKTNQKSALSDFQSFVGGQILLSNFQDECLLTAQIDNQAKVKFFGDEEAQKLITSGKELTGFCSLFSKMAEDCIKCLQYHLKIGQFKMSSKVSFEDRQQGLKNNNLGLNKNENDMIYDFQRQALIFSPRNPYVVKLQYSQGAEILGNFQKGFQLVQKIPNLYSY